MIKVKHFLVDGYDGSAASVRPSDKEALAEREAGVKIFTCTGRI